LRGAHVLLAAAALTACVLPPRRASAEQAATDEAPQPPLTSPQLFYKPRSGVGLAFMAGAGLTDFALGDLHARTTAGPFWTLRAVGGTRRRIGAEITYFGAAQSIEGLGLTTARTLLANGVEGSVRVNAPIALPPFLVELFVLGGAGWTRYSVLGLSNATANLSPTNDALTTPFGGGVSFGYRGIFADVRFTYRPTFHNQLVTGTSNGDLTNWALGIAAGYEL